MDGSRFDRLAREVAGTSSRRKVLTTALMSVLGGGLAGLHIGDADAASLRRPGEICRKSGDCASGRCGPKDRTGRSVCLCVVPANCPQPAGTSVCKSATCSPEGVCGSGPSADAAVCNGGVCLSSQCVAGACAIDGVAYDEGEVNPQNTCQACVSATSRSAWTTLGNGAACGDLNNLCQSSTCQSGVCTLGFGVACLNDDPCQNKTCNPATGTCQGVATNESGVCNTASSNPCSTGTDGTCKSGVCVSTAKPDGTFCGTETTCTQDVCSGGVCITANKFNGIACKLFESGTAFSCYEAACLDGQCVPDADTAVSCRDTCYPDAVCSTDTPGVCLYGAPADPRTACDADRPCCPEQECYCGPLPYNQAFCLNALCSLSPLPDVT